MAISKKNEPRKRAQIVTPRRRVSRKASRRTSSINLGELLKSATSLVKPAAALVGLILLIVGYNVMADSSLFDLRRVDLSGVSSELQPEVKQVVLSAVNQSRLLSLNLATIKRRIEELPRVREASVARVLPDGLYIRTVEREPAVLVRRQSQSLVWLDKDAVEVGGLSDVKHERDVPPIVKGFAEGNRSPAAVNDDQERIALFRTIEREFKNGDQNLWDLIDEIDLSLTRRVNIRLKRLPITIIVGAEDFRNRFETALKILGAAKQGDSELLSRFGVQDANQMIQNRDRIAYMDASRPDRIVYNFSSPVREKVQESVARRQEDQAANRKPAAPSRPSANGTEPSRPRRVTNQAGGLANAKGK